MKTITLEVIQPSTGPVCPGQEVILTCTVVRTGQASDLILIWRQDEVLSSVAYDIVSPQFGSHTLGDFNTTADFITSTNSLVINFQCHTKICLIFKQQQHNIMRESSSRQCAESYNHCSRQS